MSEARSTAAWIFLAVHYACSKTGAGLRDIEAAADGINHAIPTQEELRSSFKILLDREFLTKHGKRYFLTTEGQNLITEAQDQSKTVMGVWSFLSARLPDESAV